MHICPYCGAENADNSTFCSLCLGKFGSGIRQSRARDDAGAPGRPHPLHPCNRPLNSSKRRSTYPPAIITP